MTATHLTDVDPAGAAVLVDRRSPDDSIARPVTNAEVRFAATAIALALLVFGGLLLLAGPFFPSFDEQKYLGIAYNLWSGRGLTTVFGATFTLHAPLWTVLLGMPHALFGGDNVGWGQILDAIAGLGVVLAAGWLGWRIRPVAGAVAATAMLAMLYLHDQTRTARLDVPAAALELGYLAVGFEALRRRSTRWAIAAGTVFALGFLVKEVNLPVAPAPFLAGALRGAPWRAVARTAGWATLAAAVGTGWWFVLFAAVDHEVYRLGTPVWTLVPLGLVVATVIVVGLAADRIADTPPSRRLVLRLERALPSRVVENGRSIATWIVALGWAGLLTAVFLRTARLSGTGGLGPAQLALYARTWFGPLAAALAIVVFAAGVAVVAAIVDPRRLRRAPVADLVVASLCGLPLVLLVVAVGEPPRNYLAQIAVIAALAAGGIVWAGERLLAIRRPAVLIALGVGGGILGGVVVRELLAVALHLATPPRLDVFLATGAVVGVAFAALPVVGGVLPAERGDRLRSALGASLVVAALLASSVVLGAHALARRTDSTDPARAAAVDTVSTWLRANVDPSQTVAFGSFLGYDMALGVQGRNDVVQVRHRLSVGSAAAPEGIVFPGERPADDWIAIDIAPRNASQFQAYRAAWLRSQLPRSRVDVWVYSIGIDTAAPSIIPALTPDHGFDLLEHWSFPVGAGSPPIETFAFRVNRDRIGFDTSRLYVSPEALGRLADLLDAHRTVAAPAAAALAARVVVTPASAASDADLDRLRAIAAGS